MSAIIATQIELDKIPADKIKTFKRKDGSTGKAIDVTIAVNDETKYGNNTSMYVSQSKEEREAKANRTYLSNGRVVWTDGNIVTAERDDDNGNAPTGGVPDDADETLPF